MFQHIIQITAKWGDIEQRCDIEQSYPFHGNSLVNSSYNIHVTRCLCFRLHTEVFCSPTPKFFKCPHNPWPSLLPKQKFSNKKIWCLETKLWTKVTFSQRVQGYAETSVWFVHVTNCYCSGKKNLNKFFLTTKLPVVQSYPILMGPLWTTLIMFVWQKRMRNEPVVFALWWSISFRKNIENCSMLPYLTVLANVTIFNQRAKRAFKRWNKHFSSFLNSFQLRNKPDLRVHATLIH